MTNSNFYSHLYGFTDMKSLYQRGPIIISRGKGIYVFDINNKKYLDANSGLWNACAGFDHPGLIKAAKDQYDKLIEPWGGVDNILKIHSLNSNSLSAHVKLYKTVMYGKSPIRRTDREMIAVVVSTINHCHY